MNVEYINTRGDEGIRPFRVLEKETCTSMRSNFKNNSYVESKHLHVFYVPYTYVHTLVGISILIKQKLNILII